jgi:hypothetical protein
MATITPIYRHTKLPIINGFVSVPDNPINKRIDLADALLAVAGSTVEVNPFITDNEQRLFVLPSWERDNMFPEDYYAQLRSASSSV